MQLINLTHPLINAHAESHRYLHMDSSLFCDQISAALANIIKSYVWGYYCLKYGREQIMHGSVGMYWTKINT